MRKKILITGGSGFIGSHLCVRLLNDGHYIVCLDNLYSSDKSNINTLLSHSNFEFIHHDICEPIDMQIDEIYNLACPASPVNYQKDPVKTIKTNVLGSINILELARKYNAKVLQASTSEIYGSPNTHPQPEGYWGNVNPIGVRSCYDEGKRSAETLFSDFHRQYNLDIRIARIFNTYGPNMLDSDGRVVSNFIMQALQNKSITMYGNGEQTRSFCYVDDLITGLINLMDCNKTPFIYSPINLGKSEEITIANLAKMIINLTQSTSDIIYKDLPSNDPHQRCPDLKLAKELINWTPTTTLEDGLQKTIEYFKISQKN